MWLHEAKKKNTDMHTSKLSQLLSQSESFNLFKSERLHLKQCCHYEAHELHSKATIINTLQPKWTEQLKVALVRLSNEDVDLTRGQIKVIRILILCGE